MVVKNLLEVFVACRVYGERRGVYRLLLGKSERKK